MCLSPDLTADVKQLHAADQFVQSFLRLLEFYERSISECQEVDVVAQLWRQIQQPRTLRRDAASEFRHVGSRESEFTLRLVGGLVLISLRQSTLFKADFLIVHDLDEVIVDENERNNAEPSCNSQEGLIKQTAPVSVRCVHGHLLNCLQK